MAIHYPFMRFIKKSAYPMYMQIIPEMTDFRRVFNSCVFLKLKPAHHAEFSGDGFDQGDGDALMFGKEQRGVKNIAMLGADQHGLAGT